MKITNEIVTQIRNKYYNEGISKTDLRQEFNLAKSTLSSIISFRSYKEAGSENTFNKVVVALNNINKEEGEIFSPIANFPEYLISNFGNVISLNYKRTGLPKKLILVPDKDGYLTVPLTLNNKSKACKVHRLVAEAFIANSNNKAEVNHIDGDKTNNSYINLEWATHLENMQHAYRIGLFKKDHNSTNTDNSEKIIEVLLNRIAKIRETRNKLKESNDNLINLLNIMLNKQSKI